ncbi:MAG: hypothetical protein Q8M29_00930 [Bacteroidota bacterium]|nr:hypothetical protein [Bacteroidota bacterium]
MTTEKDIAQRINIYRKDIIESLKQESIEVYLFLKSQLETTDITKNYLYQFAYRHFYGMNRAGLTEKFYEEYFKILEEYKNNSKAFKLEKAIEYFGKFNSINRKGEKKSLQFSFLTKLSHSINPDNPIYDKYVCKACGIKQYYISDTNKKLESLLLAYKQIGDIYSKIAKENSLLEVLKEFDKKFNNNEISLTMKYDFIFWQAGKVLESQEIKA